jgi:hypothetical protein
MTGGREAGGDGGADLLERAFAAERSAEADVDRRQEAACEGLSERNDAGLLP